MDEIGVKLKRYAEQVYAEGGSPVISGLTNISSGWESDVYGFQLESGPPSDRCWQELILRIYPGGYADQKAEGEYRTLTLLYQMGYPVPQVFRLETDHAWFGQPFIIMERIEGRTLWPVLFQGPVEEQEKWLSLYCSLMLQLHRLNWRPYVPEEAEKEGDPFQYTRKELERASWYVGEYGLNEFEPLIEWLNARLPAVPCEQPCVVHWDLHPQNIMVRPDGSPRVIDWTNAVISDARFDLAWALILIEAYEGVEWCERVQAEYERQAGAPLVGMDFFIAYACARRLFSVLISMKAGAGSLGMRPGAEQIMKGQREPLKRVAERLKTVTGFDLVDVDRLMDA